MDGGGSDDSSGYARVSYFERASMKRLRVGGDDNNDSGGDSNDV